VIKRTEIRARGTSRTKAILTNQEKAREMALERILDSVIEKKVILIRLKAIIEEAIEIEVQEVDMVATNLVETLTSHIIKTQEMIKEMAISEEKEATGQRGVAEEEEEKEVPLEGGPTEEVLIDSIVRTTEEIDPNTRTVMAQEVAAEAEEIEEPQEEITTDSEGMYPRPIWVTVSPTRTGVE
jgi:hypothetical protein